MTKRAILNTTSRKKRNGMLTYSNTATTGSGQGISRGSMYVAGSIGAWVVWNATAQSLNVQGSTTPGVIADVATRTSTSCYMRGLSEHIRIQTSSGIPWFHRRIVFCYKAKASPFNTSGGGDTPTLLYQPYLDGTNGIERLMLNQYVNAMPNTIAAQQEILFKGAQNVDWDDPITAPVDNTRVDLMYDRTFVYRSGNTAGTLREAKVWHSMNKTLVYDDDETGAVEVPQYQAVADKRGMGNCYVLDVIQAGAGASASDLLSMNSSSTLYWHER